MSFSIPQAANRVFHLSADSLALADAATVSTWTDSINGVNATASGGAQPTFRTAIFGGKPGIRFNGTSNIMTLASPTALAAAVDSQTYSVAIVCRVLSVKATGIMFGAGTSGATLQIQGNGTTIGRYYNSNPELLSYPSAANGFFVSGMASGPVKTNGFGSGLERAYLNGGCYTCNTAKAPGSGGGTFSIGAKSDANLFSNVEIFEIVVWNSVITPTEMAQFQGWACEKYGQPTPWSSSNQIVVFDGDSITMGIGSSSIAGSYPYKAAASLGLTPGQWHNMGVQGVQARDMVNNASDFTGIPALTSVPMKVAMFEYYNERATTPTTLQGYINAYSAAIRGVANTKLCLGTSTSHNADLTASPDTNRSAFNAYYDTNSATYSDAYVPIHTAASNIGPVNSTASSPSYFSDGIHLTDLGYTQLASVMQTGIASITFAASNAPIVSTTRKQSRNTFGIRR